MKLSWASGNPHATRNAEIAAMLTGRAHGGASARQVGSPIHPGIYVHAGMTPRDGLLCYFCSGAGCGRCDITGRVCARANALRCERPAYPVTGGIPKGTVATKGASDKPLSCNKKKSMEEYSQCNDGPQDFTRRSVSLTHLSSDVANSGALPVGGRLKGHFPGMEHISCPGTLGRSVSLTTIPSSNGVLLGLVSHSGSGDSPKDLSDSESNSGASQGASGSGGETTASEQFPLGRCIDSPVSSDATPTAELENSSDSGGSGSGGSPRSYDEKPLPKPQVGVRSSSVDSPKGSPSCTTRALRWQVKSPRSGAAWRGSVTSDLRGRTGTLMHCRGRDSPQHLSDSESHSGASLSGASGSGGTTTASEQCSRASLIDSPPSSDATPTLELENSSDSGRSLDGSGGSGSGGSPRSHDGKSPLEPQVRLRSSSVDSPLGSPIQSPRFTRGHVKSRSPRLGKDPADRQRATSLEPSSIKGERWYKTAMAAKKKGVILGQEFECLKEEMSELADDFCRLRSFFP